MNPPPSAWNRLAAAARRAPPVAVSEEAPHGFATRMAARGLAARATAPSLEVWLFSRYGLRALGVSCLLAIAGVATTLRPALAAIESEAAALSDTSVESEASIDV